MPIRLNYQFIRALGNALRYEAGLDSIDGLLHSLSIADWNNTEGTSASRDTVAEALDDAGRQQEADLLRSGQPIYVSAGKVLARIANPKAEQQFAAAYLKAALDRSHDPDDNQLSDQYAVRDLDLETRSDLLERAIAFINDTHHLLAPIKQLPSPAEIARLAHTSANQEPDTFDRPPHLQHFGREAGQELRERAERDGPYHLTINSLNKVVRDRSKWPI